MIECGAIVNIMWDFDNDPDSELGPLIFKHNQKGMGNGVGWIVLNMPRGAGDLICLAAMRDQKVEIALNGNSPLFFGLVRL